MKMLGLPMRRPQGSPKQPQTAPNSPKQPKRLVLIQKQPRAPLTPVVMRDVTTMARRGRRNNVVRTCRNNQPMGGIIHSPRRRSAAAVCDVRPSHYFGSKVRRPDEGSTPRGRRRSPFFRKTTGRRGLRGKVAPPAGSPGACACARPAQGDIPSPVYGLWWLMTRPHQTGASAAAVWTSSLSIADLWTESIKFCRVQRRQTEVGRCDLGPAMSFSRPAPVDVRPAGRKCRSSPLASKICRPGGRGRSEPRPPRDSATERGNGKSTRHH